MSSTSEPIAAYPLGGALLGAGAVLVWNDVSDRALGSNRIVNLPGTSVPVDEMVAALRAVGGDEAVTRISWQRDAAVERIVGGWPGAWDVTRALSLGLSADASFEAIVRTYIEDELGDAAENAPHRTPHVEEGSTAEIKAVTGATS